MVFMEEIKTSRSPRGEWNGIESMHADLLIILAPNLSDKLEKKQKDRNCGTWGWGWGCSMCCEINRSCRYGEVVAELHEILSVAND